MGIRREADVVFGRDTLGLDARVLPIACLFQGQLMHQKHRDIKGRDPAPLEASAKIRQLRRRGQRAAPHRAGPPSTQLLTSRKRGQGQLAVYAGPVHPKTEGSSKNKKNKAPSWTLPLSSTSGWPAGSSSLSRALGGVGGSRLGGGGWGSRSSSQPQG